MTNLEINNKSYPMDLQGHETLLEVLRDKLGLTGTKSGCEEAECGACTVLVDGKAILSCITLACDVEGQKITTIEGLSEGEKLHPLQEAFLNEGAVQCGFCTPGMILASKALLDLNPHPNQEEMENALDGNLCRCTGYLKIFDAIQKASEQLSQKNEKKPNS